MSKVMSVKEALESISGRTNEKGEIVLNRFNKKNFNTLLVALANDSSFTTKVAKTSKTEGYKIEEIMVTKEFRKWLRNLIMSTGVDRMEANKVLDDTFEITDMKGLYDFFEAAMYEYMNAGNRFDFNTRSDFKASMSLYDMKEETKITKKYNPKTREYIGEVSVTKKKHKKLKVRSNCPKWLKDRI